MKLKQKIVSIIIAFIILLFANISLGANTATITVETARLRESPSQDSSILELISINEEVEILKQEGEWYQVKYNGVTGYLRNDLLKVANQDDNNTNTETNEENTTNNTTPEGNTTDQTSNQTTQNTDNATDTTNTTENGTTNNETNNNENTNQETEQITDISGRYIVSEATHLKLVPLINSLEAEILQANDKVEIQELINGWAHVSNDTVDGWIRYEKLAKIEVVEEQTETETNTTESNTPEEKPEEVEEQTSQTKYVNAETVNVRKEASTSASIVTQITRGTEVEIISEESGWYKVKVNGVEGYIATTLLSDTKQETSRGATEFRDTANELEEEKAEDNTNNKQDNNEAENNSGNNGSSNSATSNSNSNTGSAVLAFAKKFLGYPYVYGGASPSGFDCSGFTSYVYKNFGVTLSRTAAGQTSNGTAVKRSELQVGDLVMFCSPINHVGIYAGNNQIIHAANPSRGVVIDTISSGYYNTNYNCARRIF